MGAPQKAAALIYQGANLITDFAQQSKLTFGLLFNRIFMNSCEPRVCIYFFSVSLCCKEGYESRRVFSLLPCFLNLWLLKTPCVVFLHVDFVMIFCGFLVHQATLYTIGILLYMIIFFISLYNDLI